MALRLAIFSTAQRAGCILTTRFGKHISAGKMNRGRVPRHRKNRLDPNDPAGRVAGHFVNFIAALAAVNMRTLIAQSRRVLCQRRCLLANISYRLRQDTYLRRQKRKIRLRWQADRMMTRNYGKLTLSRTGFDAFFYCDSA